MKTIIWFRACAALVLGLVITMMIALALVAVGIPYALLVQWWASWRHPLELVPRLWAIVMHKLCLSLLHVKVEVSGKIKPLAPNEYAVVLGNHPFSSGVPSVVWLIGSRVASRLAAVGKLGQALNPIGWAMLIVPIGILIKRGKQGGAGQTIKRYLDRAIAPGKALLLFADQHRPTATRLQEDWAKFGEEGVPGLATLVPRVGGLAVILEGLRGKRVRVLDITCAFSVQEFHGGLKDLVRLYGATLHLDLEDVTEQFLLIDREKLQEALMQRWRWKNRLIESWRNLARTRQVV